MVTAPDGQRSGSGTSVGSELDGRLIEVRPVELPGLPGVEALAVAAPPALIALARSPSGAVTTRWRLVQPSATQAAGVPAAIPAAIRVSAMSARCSTAISSTSVVPPRASAAQSTLERGSPGPACPDTTVNPWVSPRWVTGIPAAAGTELAA